jgi:hypothetical protein
MTIQESFQPRGKELEYRIVAVNRADDGEPSNRNGCSVRFDVEGAEKTLCAFGVFFD